MTSFYLHIDYEKNTVEELSEFQLIFREDKTTQEERKNKQIKDEINKIFDMFLYKLDDNDTYNDDYKIMTNIADMFGYYSS